MGFSRKAYWSGFLCPPLGILPDAGIEPKSFMSPALAGRVFVVVVVVVCFFVCLFCFFTNEPLGKPFTATCFFSFNLIRSSCIDLVGLQV